MVDLSEMEFLQTAEEAARIAGDVLESWAKRFTVTEKGPSDLVTEADLAAQEAIFKFIHNRFPDHTFLGEEGLAAGDGRSPYRWIIDPLDGTSNYVHRFPYYAVSIGLQCEGMLLAGVIYDPNRDELFSALRQQGATLNGTPIHPSRTNRLDQAMVVASLPVTAQPDNRAVQQFLKAMPHVQTIQRTGSAALNLAYVAMGRIDAFWSTSLKPWDMAAGVLIIEEAGGRVTKINGDPFDVTTPDLLSSNGLEIHGQLQKLLS